jgi:ribosome-binding factor A
MSSRRLEKVSKVIRSAVSDIIRDDISDPRVNGLISVTHVDVSADLRNAKITLGIQGVDERGQQLCLMGINHASGFIRSQLASQMTMKTCPALIFYLDTSAAARFETMQLLNQISEEFADRAETDKPPDNTESPSEESKNHYEK